MSPHENCLLCLNDLCQNKRGSFPTERVKSFVPTSVLVLFVKNEVRLFFSPLPKLLPAGSAAVWDCALTPLLTKELLSKRLFPGAR